jgi:phosphoribosyl 1,2-cyclic phosphodiesterase
MKTFTLSTGSSGNSFYVESSKGIKLLVDCGLSYSKTKDLLLEKDIELEKLDAILITHEHSDHIFGLEQFIKNTNIPIYISKGTFSALKFKFDETKNKNIHFVKHHDSFTLTDINILILNRAHDSKEAISFIFKDHHKKLGIFTDLGHIDNESKHILKTLDIIYFETNYCDEIISQKKDSFHHTYINRLTSNIGHLSLSQAITALKDFAHNEQTIILSHISENTNTYTNSYSKVKQALNTYNLFPNLQIGFQNEASDWYE